MNDQLGESPTPSSPVEEPEKSLLARGWDAVTDAAETAADVVADKAADAQEFIGDKVAEAREFIEEKIHPADDAATAPASTEPAAPTSAPKPHPPTTA